MRGPEPAPRGARPFVAALLVAMVVSAVLAWEPWPLTSFRLFSTLRGAEQLSWQATAVDRQGAEQGYPLGSMPQGFRGFPFTMREFVAAGRARRDELCRTWVAATPELLGWQAAEVRIYQRRRLLSDRVGDRSRTVGSELRYVCSGRGEGGADAG